MRLFIASKLPEPAALAAGALLAAARPLFDDAVKWTRPENLHLTYLFLGETPEAEVPRLTELLRNAAAGAPRVRAELGGLGTFPPSGRPRVLWLGLREEKPGLLAAFARRLAAELAPGAGFTPHITLGRPRALLPPAALEELARAAALRLQVELGAAGLYESRLTPAGPDYVELCSAPFGNP